MQLASFWSIDPTTLDEQFKEPEMGLLGNVHGPRAEPVDEVNRGAGGRLMGVDLYSESGDSTGFGYIGWSMVLDLAERYG